jgi:hypothetical protein
MAPTVEMRGSAVRGRVGAGAGAGRAAAISWSAAVPCPTVATGVVGVASCSNGAGSRGCCTPSMGSSVVAPSRTTCEVHMRPSQ